MRERESRMHFKHQQRHCMKIAIAWPPILRIRASLKFYRLVEDFHVHIQGCIVNRKQYKHNNKQKGEWEMETSIVRDPTQAFVKYLESV